MRVSSLHPVPARPTSRSFCLTLRLIGLICGWVLLPLSGQAKPEFSTGRVAVSNGADFHQHTTPQVARLGNGQLMAVMGVRAKGGQLPSRIGAALSADGGTTWSSVRILYTETAKDRAVGDPNMLVDGNRLFVYWSRAENPNLIKRSWVWGMRSEDNGATWSEPQEISIPRQYPVGKQHNAIKLTDGTYAMGLSWDRWPEHGYNAKTEGETNIASGLLRSEDGINWKLFGDLHVLVEKTTPKAVNGLAEPAVVQLGNDELYMVLRSGASHPYVARSRDGGITWSVPEPSPLVGHNSPSALWRVEGTANDIVVVWNNSPLLRKPLAAALSSDGGVTWSKPRNIGVSAGLGISYPGLTQTSEGNFVAVWQVHPSGGGRDIHYAIFNREWLLDAEN